MKDDLDTLYQASLAIQAHLVMYRMPGSKAIKGIAASYLSKDITNQTGFLISSYDKKNDSQIVPEEITFVKGEQLVIEERVKNNFTSHFIDRFRQFQASDTKSFLPFFFSDSAEEHSRFRYEQLVKSAIFEMKSGEMNKVVLSRIKQKPYTHENEPVTIFKKLVAKYPDAFVSLISSPEYGTWIGASPELLLWQMDDAYTTVALAGTKKSDNEANFGSKEIDEQYFIQQYLKEKLEERNITFNQTVTENYNTGSLTHLRTVFHFNSSAGSRVEIAGLLHPTPAICGYPENEAKAFIASNENYDRELYAGYIGFIAKDEMALFVNIRCMKWYPDFAQIYAGAGITLASDEASEWEETENKTEVIGSVL
jgi:isochorismate synthase